MHMSTNSCNPLNSVYCNLKVKLAGGLSDKDLNGLYSCTLCNECHTAGLNRGAREIAVSKNLIAPHLSAITGNIRRSGNPYGAAGAREGKGPDAGGTILFRGCTPTYKTPEILDAVQSLLARQGITYGFIDDEPCCGNILFNLGDRVSGSEIVEQNISKFKAAGIRRIITVCPGCYAAFNKYYKGRDGFEPEVILAVDLLDGMTMPAEGFVVQDPCHAKEKSESVRRMLPGAGNKNASPCCGAGSGLMTHDRVMAGEKAKKAFNGGTSKVVTYCPFCYLNLSSVKPGEVADLYVLIDSHGDSLAPQSASFTPLKTGTRAEARSPVLEKLAAAVHSIVG
jgi:fumarate reductase (CoM/CoB) subunit B